MRIRYGWELALAALLVIEIVAFGAINPRMLDLNSTKVLVDSRWRLQISLTWMCWDSPFR